METVRQLNEHDAHIADHRQKHLAQAFNLGIAAVRRQACHLGDADQLGDAIHQAGDLRPELLGQIRHFRRRVLDYVVQQRCGHRAGVQTQVSQDTRDGQGVLDVGFAGLASLTLVGSRGHVVGVPHQRNILWRITSRQFVFQTIQGHRYQLEE